MCNDILPQCVQEYLEDFETGLCLPIVFLIVFCTVQLMLRHSISIMCTVKRIMKKRKKSAAKQKPSALMKKIKGMFSCPGELEFGKPQTDCQSESQQLRSTDSYAWIDAGEEDEEDCEEDDA